MKRFFTFLLALGLIVAALNYWPQILSFLGRQPQLNKIIQNNSTLENLKQQVSTGGALRGKQDSPDAYLTRLGVINFTNQARQENGSLPALKESSKLDLAAQNKLKDMFAQLYFEHISPDGRGPSDLAKTAGYQYVLIGENLALGNFKNDAALVDAWMNSPGHRANILQPKYEEIGVAVGQGKFEGRNVWLAVQEFGKPLSSCPWVDQNLKDNIDSLRSDISSILPQMQELKNYLDTAPQPKNKQEADAYNKKVAEYNDLVRIYNNKVDQIKTAVAQYNSEVEAFNACAS